MNDTQKKLYELLTKFDGLCKKFGIVYYLGGGSALGAVRHKGFLPWDDDVDLYITRKNYLKLLEVEDQFFDDDFVLVNSDKYPRYGNTLVRCVDTHSTAITKARMVDETPKGQFVELFILDPLPRDKDEQSTWFTKHWIYTELLSYAFCVCNVRIASHIDEELYYSYLKKYKTLGRKKVLKELEEYLFTIDESQADQYCSRWGFRNLIYNIEWFGEPRYVPFEDTFLPVAAYAENVLRFDYGDNWMYIPNVEEQVTHSFAESMNIGYKNIVKDYRQFFDANQIFETYIKRKDLQMEVHFANLKAHFERANLKKAQVLASIEYKSKHSDQLDKWFEEYNMDAIENFFSQWYLNQFHDSFWSWKTLLRLDDHLLYLALMPVLLKGTYSKVRTILLWRAEEGALSDELKNMQDFVEHIRDAYIALDNHALSSCTAILDEIKQIPLPYKEKQLDYRKLALQTAISNTTESDALNRLKEDCQSLLNDFPDNGEILCCMADIYYKLHDHEKAAELYRLAYGNTSHGFVRMHIEEIMNTLNEDVVLL